MWVKILIGVLIVIACAFGVYDQMYKPVWDDKLAPFQDRIAASFYREDFSTLEAIVKELRQKKTRTLSGGWYLTQFYFNIVENAKDKEETLRKLNRWREQYPQSVAQRISLARLYFFIASDARGSGWADTVSDENWGKMDANLKIAEQALIEAEQYGDHDDPYLYTIWISVAPHKDQFMEFLDRGLAIEPTYNALYERVAQFLLPKWGGAPGEFEHFIDDSVQRTKATEGNALYARFAMSFDNSGHSDDYMEHMNPIWPKVKQGFIDMRKKFPRALYNEHYFCLLACKANDKETARRLFSKLGNQWERGMGSIWNNPNTFFGWKKWANGETDLPPKE